MVNNPFQQFVQILGDPNVSAGIQKQSNRVLDDPLQSGGSQFAAAFLNAFTNARQAEKQADVRQQLAQALGPESIASTILQSGGDVDTAVAAQKLQLESERQRRRSELIDQLSASTSPAPGLQDDTQDLTQPARSRGQDLSISPAQTAGILFGGPEAQLAKEQIDIETKKFEAKEDERLFRLKRTDQFIDESFKKTEVFTREIPTVQSQLQELETLASQGIKTGPLTPFLSVFQKTIDQAGISLDLSDVTSFELLSATAKGIATPLAKQLGVNPTDRDFQNILDQIADETKVTETNFALTDLRAQKAVQEKRVEDFLFSAEKEGIGKAAVRSGVRKIREQNRAVPARAIPVRPGTDIVDTSKLIKGQRYRSSKGIFIWDGEKPQKVSYNF